MANSKEFILETQENRREFLQDSDYDDDAEETLSFCDLPLHSKSFSDWDDNFSKLEDFQSSSFDDHDNFFEFISEDFSISGPKLDNIIFCGKLISYKESTDQKLQMTNNLEITNATKKNRFLFPWKSQSFNKSKQQQQKNAEKSYKTCKSLPPLRVQEERKGYAAAATRIDNSVTKKNDASMKRVSMSRRSIAAANSRKSRWRLFAFGVGRLIPRKMELSDMKTRQSKRRSPMKMFPSVDGSDHEMINSSRNRAKDLWGLLGARVSVLGCINPQF